MEDTYIIYQLMPGSYWIGDPLYMLNTSVFNQLYLASGLHMIYNEQLVIVSTGFDEGEFKDAYHTNYLIESGYIGIFPHMLCTEHNPYRLSQIGKFIEFYEPFRVYINEDGYFKISYLNNFELILDTRMDNFEENDLI